MLYEKINQYFEHCDKINEGAKVVKPYTLSGLLYFLGFSKEEFEEIGEMRRCARLVTEAKLRIESHIEENALNGKLASSAAINSLKCNFGWSDKQDKGALCRSFSVFLEDEADELGA